MTVVRASRRRRLVLGRDIGGGGEATVYEVAGQPDLLAKIYNPPPRPGYDRKLAWMRANPPDDPTRARGHTSIAWPLDLLYSDQGLFMGYLMHYIRNAVPLLEVFNPRLRAQTLPGFDWRYLHRAARNLAVALGALHVFGYVVGDLNESNVMVTPSAMVTLIDTDSFQVRTHNSGNVTTFFCPVGKPEYTPPELQGRTLRDTPQYPEHDCFGLGVLVYQLLMNGSHPFRAQWLGDGDPPSVEERIRQGAFPHMKSPPLPVAPPRNTPGLGVLHTGVAELVQRCFIDGHRKPRKRPSPGEWERVITEAEQALEKCANGHYYSNHLSVCPRCGEEPKAALVQSRFPRLAISSAVLRRPTGSPSVALPQGTPRRRLPMAKEVRGAFVAAFEVLRRKLRAMNAATGGVVSGALVGALVWATAGAAFGAIGGTIASVIGQWMIWALVWAVIWASGWWAFGEVLGETIGGQALGKGVGVAGAIGGAIVGGGLGWAIGHRGIEEIRNWVFVKPPVELVNWAAGGGELKGVGGAAFVGMVSGAFVWAVAWALVGAVGGAVGWQGIDRHLLGKGFGRVPGKVFGTLWALAGALEGATAGTVFGIVVGAVTGGIVGLVGRATGVTSVGAVLGLMLGALIGAVGGTVGVRYIEGIGDKLGRIFGMVEAVAGATAGVVVARGGLNLWASEEIGVPSLLEGVLIGLVSGALVGAISGALAGAISGAIVRATDI